MSDLVKRSRELLAKCTIGKTDNYLGEWCIGDNDALEMAELLEQMAKELEAVITAPCPPTEERHLTVCPRCGYKEYEA